MARSSGGIRILQGSFTHRCGAHGAAATRGGTAAWSAAAARARGEAPLAWAPAALEREPGRGRSLDARTRSEMERLYGASFASVRIHHTPSVHALGARAVTIGEQIHFGLGEYEPLTESGAALLCRELGHVVQQRQLTAPHRFAGVPIVREPWLEAEATRRSLDLIAQRRRSRGAEPRAIQRMEPLTIGVIVGSVVVGGVVLGALGRYLYRRWRGAPAAERLPQQPQPPRLSADELFTLAWNVTQTPSVDEPLGDVLIISDAETTKDRTGDRLHAITSLTRTYYSDDWFNRNRTRLDETWLKWNWVTEEFPRAETFDTIIARSMICACTEEHFDGGSVARGNLISTCGGVGLDDRAVVLGHVIGLLRQGGRAIFTVSRQGGVGPKTRSTARTMTRDYWRPVLATLPGNCRVTELSIPVDGIANEPAGDYFGFVIERL